MSNIIEQLGKKVGKKWDAIKDAENRSIKIKEEIADLIKPNGTRLFNSDCEFIIFGSLARNEFTTGSDLDWTLLIDGTAKLDHQDIVVKLRNKLKMKYAEPGITGTFGGLAFSHDIIHHIGGLEDTNINTTRRLLLLLESEPIIKMDENIVYKNVIKNILQRYLNKSFITGDIKFPRFLMNDIVRYWRLICIDFAAKEWEHGDYKWVIRNIKLRFSRKLLFVMGMLICYSFYESRTSELDQEALLEVIIKDFVLKTPLEIMASFSIKNDLIKIGEKLLTCYDYFLSQLEKERDHLENLKPSAVTDSLIYKGLREQGHIFQETLTDMFFREETELKEFIIKFGVF
jgi:predicted nucleotidyltransferase